MSLFRQDSDQSLHVRVSPMWSDDNPYNIKSLSRPVAAIYVADPNMPQETQTELLQRLYGLTPSEARLTERIVSGRALKDAAKDLGVTEGTTRTQLKVIFGKIGVNRQPELVKAVMSAPTWIGLQEKRDKFLN